MILKDPRGRRFPWPCKGARARVLWSREWSRDPRQEQASRDATGICGALVLSGYFPQQRSLGVFSHSKDVGAGSGAGSGASSGAGSGAEFQSSFSQAAERLADMMRSRYDHVVTAFG